MSFGRQGRSWGRKTCPKRKKCHWARWMNAEGKSRHSSCRFSKAQRRGRKVRVNRHHMTTESHGGRRNRRNILWMKVERHESLHHYFGNLKWESIADFIYCGDFWSRKSFRGLSRQEVSEVLFSIFGRYDPMACVELMDRVSRAKRRITRVKERLPFEVAA